MNTYYFHLFFGEIHTYQVTAESFDSALGMAIAHGNEHNTFCGERSFELISKDSNERSFLFRDVNDPEFGLHVVRYMGESPWTTTEPAEIDNDPLPIYGASDKRLKNDFTHLGEFAVILP